MPHFIDLSELSPSILKEIIALANKVKKDKNSDKVRSALKHKQLAMIFEKPSTRTRASFQAGIQQLGGNATILESGSTQLGRGESPADTAKVLSRYVDIIMIRCFNHETLLEIAQHATVPVINGLTDFSHPCQIMADIMTYEEHRGSIQGKKVAWLGDGNNVTNSWIHAASKFEFELAISTPTQLKPDDALINQDGGNISWSKNPEEVAQNADIVTTDTWVSMGDADADFRHKLLDPYRVNKHIMSLANQDAVFMHCLPAHRDEEVSSDVIDGPQSIVFDEAENRLHIQKAIMLWCLDVTDF